MSDPNEVNPQNDPIYSPNTEATGAGIPSTNSSGGVASVPPTTPSSGLIGDVSTTGSDLSEY